VRELFVWYRVDRRNAAAARVEVEAMQRTLERAIHGLQARLLIRHDADHETWMETYARQPRAAGGRAGVDDAAESAIAAASLPLRRLLASDRHVEAFDDVAAP
jgi:hypothetical protein